FSKKNQTCAFKRFKISLIPSELRKTLEIGFLKNAKFRAIFEWACPKPHFASRPSLDRFAIAPQAPYTP
ncbi:MAG: hypothetical protein J6T65_10620, partial [Clostridia bacterium]|nr:hypothetical protein [Clostridia bacterium]